LRAEWRDPHQPERQRLAVSLLKMQQPYPLPRFVMLRSAATKHPFRQHEPISTHRLPSMWTRPTPTGLLVASSPPLFVMLRRLATEHPFRRHPPSVILSAARSAEPKDPLSPLPKLPPSQSPLYHGLLQRCLQLPATPNKRPFDSAPDHRRSAQGDTLFRLMALSNK
jgi:hypothetical protein